MTPLTLSLSRLQFNSMILYCVPKLRLMGQKFSVREKMDISGLQVGKPCPLTCSPGRALDEVGTGLWLLEGHHCTLFKLHLCL